MNTFNRITLVGNLAADPDLRSTKTGKKVSQFPLATNRGVVGQNGEKSKTTDYHRIIAWGPRAEMVEKYLKKGKKVFVDGRLVYRSFEDKEGKKRYLTEIVANHFELMSQAQGDRTKKELGIENGREEEEVDTELVDVTPADFVAA